MAVIPRSFGNRKVYQSHKSVLELKAFNYFIINPSHLE